MSAARYLWALSLLASDPKSYTLNPPEDDLALYGVPGLPS